LENDSCDHTCALDAIRSRKPGRHLAPQPYPCCLLEIVAVCLPERNQPLPPPPCLGSWKLPWDEAKALHSQVHPTACPRPARRRHQHRRFRGRCRRCCSTVLAVGAWLPSSARGSQVSRGVRVRVTAVVVSFACCHCCCEDFALPHQLEAAMATTTTNKRKRTTRRCVQAPLRRRRGGGFQSSPSRGDSSGSSGSLSRGCFAWTASRRTATDPTLAGLGTSSSPPPCPR